MRPKILIIGMIDSIHLSRWLNQFIHCEIDFYIFTSQKYRNIHKEIKSLIDSEHKASYTHMGTIKINFLQGYFDFLRNEILGKFFSKFTRAAFLTKVLLQQNFKYIHAVEIQSAGYLLNNVEPSLLRRSNVIITNWGSDVYYFKQFSDHAAQIKSVLAKANFYSAECERDYKLAKEFGFSGKFLPCIPNAGGFDIDFYQKNFTNPSKRNQILIKGYGGVFGQVAIVIPLIPEILTRYPRVQFHFYSVTEDIMVILKNFSVEIQNKIKVNTIRKRLSHKQMLIEFSKSRIHIGCSKSDGISTAFLESLICGAYPVQTNTSCADEWVDRGALAAIVNLDSNEILSHVLNALKDDQLVDRAAEINYIVAKKYLDYEVVQKQALEFYK